MLFPIVPLPSGKNPKEFAFSLVSTPAAAFAVVVFLGLALSAESWAPYVVPVAWPLAIGFLAHMIRAMSLAKGKEPAYKLTPMQAMKLCYIWCAFTYPLLGYFTLSRHISFHSDIITILLLALWAAGSVVPLWKIATALNYPHWSLKLIYVTGTFVATYMLVSVPVVQAWYR